ncbi:MAG: dephospho-CoA kinase [Porticoccaceae bacterium]|nr:dephospho-CoA kinase [Porticoccaceae bacterium]
MYVVGLTGGIGSGKSAVGNCFRNLGIKVVDADQMARRVVEPGTQALAEIGEHFGNNMLLADGSLNRAALREKIFADNHAKIWLEQLLHPLIRQLTRTELDSAISPYAVLESPLLIEMGQNAIVNRVLVVDVPEETQIARASSRDSNSETQIRAIIASQINRKDRLAAADDIIDNTCPLEELPALVAKLHQRYLEEAASAERRAPSFL